MSPAMVMSSPWDKASVKAWGPLCSQTRRRVWSSASWTNLFLEEETDLQRCVSRETGVGVLGQTHRRPARRGRLPGRCARDRSTSRRQTGAIGRGSGSGCGHAPWPAGRPRARRCRTGSSWRRRRPSGVGRGRGSPRRAGPCLATRRPWTEPCWGVPLGGGPLLSITSVPAAESAASADGPSR